MIVYAKIYDLSLQLKDLTPLIQVQNYKHEKISVSFYIFSILNVSMMRISNSINDIFVDAAGFSRRYDLFHFQPHILRLDNEINRIFLQVLSTSDFIYSGGAEIRSVMHFSHRVFVESISPLVTEFITYL